MEQAFFEREATAVARDLLGMLLVNETPEGRTSGIITETEAYSGINDPACHAYPYKRTPRTEVLFGPGGRAYVYFIYGMYYCFNISANRPGEPEGVLIRALKPLEGVEIMKRRYLAFQRGKAAPEKAAPPREDALCSGPGKLCRAMGIDKSHYGRDLTAAYGLRVEQSPDGAVDGGRIVTAPRINIDYAGEAKDWLWRFVYINND